MSGMPVAAQRDTPDARAAAPGAAALQLALARGRLRAHFQPIIDLASGRIVAVEALSRWIHDDGRPQVAACYLPAAREAGLFAQIDWLTVQEALRASAAWRLGGLCTASGFTHINLGQELLCQPGFSERFLAAVALAEADPRQLVVEVHENLDLAEHPAARRALLSLAEQGVSLALDDFGAGHPALLTLGELAFASIKTDRRLLLAARAGGRAARLLGWVRRLADELGAALIIEGIESADDLRIASDVGGHAAQGWLFASALSRPRIERLLQARSVARPRHMARWPDQGIAEVTSGRSDGCR